MAISNIRVSSDRPRDCARNIVAEARGFGPQELIKAVPNTMMTNPESRKSSGGRMRSMGGPILCPKNYSPCPVSISYDPNKLLVLMPFSEDQAPQKLFTDVLGPLSGWTVVRADSEFTKPEIWCKICANIQGSRAVIADLSGPNANVFLELGFAWGLGRPFIPLAQNPEGLPFDTKPYDAVKYTRNAQHPEIVENVKSLQQKIARHLRDLPEIPPLTQSSAQTPEDYLEQLIADAKQRVFHYWRKSGGIMRLVGDMPSHQRIALALLNARKRAKTQKELAAETNLSEGMVSMILRGTFGNYAKYFQKVNGGWSLSDSGIYWVIEEIVPGLTKSS